MTVDKSRYKDISFFSNFLYLREVASGFVQTSDNGFGLQAFNDLSVPIPAVAVARPPYIQYFLEFPSGTFNTIGPFEGFVVGNDNNNMYFDGFVNRDITSSVVCKVHWHVYDRAVV